MELQVSRQTISKWETGLSLPDIALLEPLADILGVTVAELLKGERIHAALEPQEMDELLGKPFICQTIKNNVHFWFFYKMWYCLSWDSAYWNSEFNMAGCKSDPEGHLCF